jgi:hypothetical protein
VQVVKAHCQHPTVRRWFYQVATFEELVAGLGVGFPMIEFRDGWLGAVVWSDGPDTWGTGGWHPLTRQKTLPMSTTHSRPVAHGRAFTDILDLLAMLRQEIGPPSRPWWRFW